MTAFHHNTVLWAIASLASIMTAFYMFRLLYLTFSKDFRGTAEQKSHLHESPALITIPLMVLAALATVGGAISLPGNSWLNGYLAPIFTKVAHEEHVMGTTEYALMAVAVVGGLVGIAIAFAKYIKQSQVPAQDDQITGFAKVLYNKYYVDEVYEALFVKPINALSNFFRDYIETFVSGVVYGLGSTANAMAAVGRRVQNGNIGLYFLVFVLSVCAIISYLFIAQ